MFPQVHRGQSLLGSMLTLAASALVVASAAVEAEAKKGFGSSIYKSHSNSSSSSHSSSHDAHHSSKRGEDLHDESKHADGKREEHEADSADTSGGGLSLKPSVSFGQDDDEAKKNEPAKDTADAPQSPAEASKPAEAAKTPAAPVARKKALVERAPHPLAAGHTGMDVTVCEAGCSNKMEQPYVAYQQVTTRKVVENVGEMKPAASGGAASDASKDLVVCLGGCYDTPRVYSTPLAKVTTSEGEWKASVTPTSADGKASGSGEWMRRIDATQDAKPGS